MPPGSIDTTALPVLSFRVAQSNAPVNPVRGMRFRVELAAGGATVASYTDRHAGIPAPYDFYRWDWWREKFVNAVDNNVMITVRIPLGLFRQQQADFDLRRIDTIRFVFDNPGQGQLYVDDIEFSR